MHSKNTWNFMFYCLSFFTLLSLAEIKGTIGNEVDVDAFTYCVNLL